MNGHIDLAGLGWTAFFADQIAHDEALFAPLRISGVHRSRLTAISPVGPVQVALPARTNTGDFAVGDWILSNADTAILHRRLDRRTVLERHVGGGKTQLAAANIDTLFIVSSCDADFNVARLERYLALANQAGTTPVVILTKADMTGDAQAYRRLAAELQRELAVVIVNPREPNAVDAVLEWCRPGQTVALVGSSGVGKSTLVNSLVGSAPHLGQRTGETREHDAKGRHTTTSRSLHPIAGGGWVVDTPGMRSLQLGEAPDGLDLLFAEITDLAPQCKFRDCTHEHEPGCAVRAAVSAGRLDPERLGRWRKLRDENAGNVSGRSKPSAGRRSH